MVPTKHLPDLDEAWLLRAAVAETLNILRQELQATAETKRVLLERVGDLRAIADEVAGHLATRSRYFRGADGGKDRAAAPSAGPPPDCA